MEFVVMCADATPEEVRDFIESRPGAELDWRDDDWRVSYGFGPEVYLDIMYLADFNSEPQWTKHLKGLAKLVREHAETDKVRTSMLKLIRRQQFGLTVLAEPDITDWSDDRLVAVKEYAEQFGSFVCDSDAIFDVRLEPVVCQGGADGRVFINTPLSKKPWWRFW